MRRGSGSRNDNEKGTWTLQKERGDGGQNADKVVSRLEGSAVEVGVRIFDLELLDDPPGRGGIGDVAAPAFRHRRVENTDHMTLAIEDERA